MILSEMGPAFAVIATLLAGVASAYLRGKARGKANARAEVDAKTNQQAANAARESRNDAEIDRLPAGGADQLKRNWLRK
ncbi:hypothetical protein [Schauerella aestuarii]|uniref:hypothetical protein n=1 Tax=Schauerella aestuarii TaxID=2511204 RepID=UPI001370E12F|nr:hypothetical protein [Achromobacter aestuarii]MYZ45185.1 hypothetical protein [Achromobacter aestuarii]